MKLNRSKRVNSSRFSSKYDKTVFITGAGGFVGANLTRKLCSLGLNVHIIVKPESNLWRLEDIKNKITIHKGNLLNKKTLSTLLPKIKPNIIYHLAAHGAYSLQNNAEEIIRVNILGTTNLLDATKNIDYDSLVITGTSSEYGFKKDPMKEDDILEPTSFYAASKASTTLLAQVFAREYKKPINILRPFSVYGPYEEETRFIPTIINALHQGKDISLTSGTQRRDFIYIDDVIDAYLLFLSKKFPEGEVFNLGTGKEYTNGEIVKMLFKVTGIKTNIKKGKYPKRKWDSSHWVADISKSKRQLKWKPKVALEEGLKKTYKWWVSRKKNENEKV